MLLSRNMGRRKREGNYSHPKNKVLQDLEQNEENRYPAQAPTKQR
jgi:hypothetical protein